jgi:hypothetical protein
MPHCENLPLRILQSSLRFVDEIVLWLWKDLFAVRLRDDDGSHFWFGLKPQPRRFEAKEKGCFSAFLRTKSKESVPVSNPLTSSE